ncbi:abortive infection family protein [Halomonas sp. JS92-SW72]|uniref:abortive infection family protein n=1 Tax=Halomonas sp. JS92-SW72 TaxID=2306583 RepID=UPI0013C341B2|nr:abortive infection family protein [Halomonas sp. JS92-SW72]
MFEKLFDVFSRREPPPANTDIKPLTEEFRNRVLMLLRDTLQYGFRDFLGRLHQKAAYLYGKFGLSGTSAYSSPEDDLLNFFATCSDEHFLDLLELIFRSDLPGITWPDNSLIPGINEFFRIDDLPYHLTGYSMEEFESSFHGTPTTAIRIKEYPQIIRKDSEVVHRKAMEPALKLLNAAEFRHANDEFLKALEDHRKGDYRDCLTKCGSSFESVMKVLCGKNAVPYNEKDTASALLKALLRNGQLEQYWEQPLILIATLRNRLSSSHGAGAQPKVIPEHVATYAVNSTASAILLLCSEFG